MATSKTWPGGANGAAPTSYQIPDVGDLNWISMSPFLKAIADGAQATTFQKFATRRATASPVEVVATADCIVITDMAVPGPVTVSLPAGSHKQVFVIIDGAGDAATNTVTITPSGADTINGAGTLAFQNNFESLWICFDSAINDWVILGRFTSSVPLQNPMSAVGDLITGGPAGAPLRLPLGGASTYLRSNGTTLEFGALPTPVPTGFTRYVGPGYYATLTAALTGATAGERILVMASHTLANLSISVDDIEIKFMPGVRITFTGADPVAITGNRILIDGFSALSTYAGSYSNFVQFLGPPTFGFNSLTNLKLEASSSTFTIVGTGVAVAGTKNRVEGYVTGTSFTDNNVYTDAGTYNDIALR